MKGPTIFKLTLVKLLWNRPVFTLACTLELEAWAKQDAGGVFRMFPSLTAFSATSKQGSTLPVFYISTPPRLHSSKCSFTVLMSQQDKCVPLEPKCRGLCLWLKSHSPTFGCFKSQNASLSGYHSVHGPPRRVSFPLLRSSYKWYTKLKNTKKPNKTFQRT